MYKTKYRDSIFIFFAAFRLFEDVVTGLVNKVNDVRSVLSMMFTGMIVDTHPGFYQDGTTGSAELLLLQCRAVTHLTVLRLLRGRCREISSLQS